MKSIILNTVVFLVMLQHNVQAQPPIQIAGVPVITDPASVAASAPQALAYVAAKAAQVAYNKELKQFRQQWDNRALYRGGAALEATKINPKLNDFKTRFTALETRNTNLSAFMYSKKKKNTKLLADVWEQFDILYAEVHGQSKLNVILGEKINLYMNMMQTITRLNRLLDIIEINIDDSFIMETRIKSMKNEPVPLTP